MNKNIEHLALDDELMTGINGGVKQNDNTQDLKRVKCRNCGELFMANSKIRPITCPTCGYDCTDDSPVAAAGNDKTTVAGNTGTVTRRAV